MCHSVRVNVVPAQVCQWVTSAAECVSFVKEVKITVLEPDGKKTPVTLEELQARNIPIKPVPRLIHKKDGVVAPAGGANNTSSSSGLSEAEAQKLRANESAALEMHKVAAEHAASLQAQLDELKARVAQQPVEAEEGGRAKRPRTSQ